MALEFLNRDRQRTNDETATVSLAPLIDVVFLLLIFFLMTASFQKETALEVNRPAAATGVPVETEPETIWIQADGTIQFQDRTTTLSGLRERLEQRAGTNPDLRVLIVSDLSVGTGRLVEVVDTARGAGVERVSIATEQEQQ